MRNARHGPLCNLLTTQTQSSLRITDQYLHCSLTESVDTVVVVDKHRMLRLNCIDAHSDLDLRVSQISCIANNVMYTIRNGPAYACKRFFDRTGWSVSM